MVNSATAADSGFTKYASSAAPITVSTMPNVRACGDRHPPIGHRPLRGAPHQAIGGALPHLIQGRGAAGDEERAEQRVHEVDQRRIRRRAEGVGRGHRQQDEEIQARLGQRDVVAGARVRLRRVRRVARRQRAKVNATSFDSFAAMVTCCVFVPSVSCHASMV